VVLFAGKKLCDPRLSALSVVATIKALYKYTSFLFPFPPVFHFRVFSQPRKIQMR